MVKIDKAEVEINNMDWEKQEDQQEVEDEVPEWKRDSSLAYAEGSILRILAEVCI